jgi:hypothetical protein
MTDSTALAKYYADAFSDVRLQQLWIATQRRAWRSLAVVGASAGVPVIDSANMLAKLTWRYSGEPTLVFDLRDVSLRLVEHQVREINVQVSVGDRVVIALRSVVENPASVPIARAADTLVLCVELGKTDAKSAQKTLDAIGRDRFLGTILVNSPRGMSADGRHSG